MYSYDFVKLPQNWGGHYLSKGVGKSPLNCEQKGVDC